jgi:hypothetical protein
MPKVKIQEQKFVLRVPAHYSAALDGIVQQGLSKSKNELIVTIIGAFLKDLEKHAKAKP